MPADGVQQVELIGLYKGHQVTFTWYLSSAMAGRIVCTVGAKIVHQQAYTHVGNAFTTWPKSLQLCKPYLNAELKQRELGIRR